jgi:hypothetical protein
MGLGGCLAEALQLRGGVSICGIQERGGAAMIERIAHALPLLTLRRLEALERYGWGPR